MARDAERQGSSLRNHFVTLRLPSTSCTDRIQLLGRRASAGGLWRPHRTSLSAWYQNPSTKAEMKVSDKDDALRLPEAQAVNILCGKIKSRALARPPAQRPDHSRLRREVGGEGGHLSGSLAVAREERDKSRC